MEILTFVFVMLVAILASNLISRFVPSVTTPIIQIVLGVIIGVLPLSFHLVLNPEWFFVLFIAPLLFYDAVLANKQSLWTQRKPILLLAFGLVFLTVLLIGFLSDLLIPSIPLAAAFALAAAVTPTDAVAVGSLSKRIRIPHNIRHLLEGESLINDASGLVSFQFAVAAMMTGAFSLLDAGVELAIVVTGGVLIGVVLTVLKLLLVRWVRLLGMEDDTFHILIGILTPFVVYLVAEHAGVSGILAVVTSGILHAIETRRLTPETVALRTTTTSVWTTFTYVLNGLVFVILGTQLPDVLESVSLAAQVDQRIVLLDVVIIVAALMAVRFVWAYFTVNPRGLDAETSPLSRTRSSAIVSVAGVRGAVTLASTMSLPFLLPDGSPFPFRETIIFIGSMVILITLLIANFLLPVLVGKGENEAGPEEETAARLAVLQDVVRQLGDLVTPENRASTARVQREYHARIADLVAKQGWSREERLAEEGLRADALLWEKENTLAYLQEHHADRTDVDALLEIIETQSARSRRRRLTITQRTTHWLTLLRGKRRIQGNKEERAEQRAILIDIVRANYLHVLDRLRALPEESDARVVKKVIADYELALSLIEQRLASKESQEMGVHEEATLTRVAHEALQLEREAIQRVFEEGRITRATAAEMRSNVDLLALRLQKEMFLGAEDEPQPAGGAYPG